MMESLSLFVVLGILATIYTAWKVGAVLSAKADEISERTRTLRYENDVRAGQLIRRENLASLIEPSSASPAAVASVPKAPRSTEASHADNFADESCGFVAKEGDSIDKLAFIALRYRALLGEAIAFPYIFGASPRIEVLKMLHGGFDLLEHVACDMALCDDAETKATVLMEDILRMNSFRSHCREDLGDRLVPSTGDLKALYVACAAFGGRPQLDKSACLAFEGVPLASTTTRIFVPDPADGGSGLDAMHGMSAGQPSSIGHD